MKLEAMIKIRMPGARASERKARTSFALKRAPSTLCAALEGELDQVAEEEDQQQQEDDQVEVEEGQHQQVGGERDLGRPGPHFEHGADHQQNEDAADDQEIALALALFSRPILEQRHHWLRFMVRRLDCTHGVSAASPAMRATHELTPPRDTSARTRT